MLNIIAILLAVFVMIVIIRKFNKLEEYWIVVCHSLLKSSRSSLEEITTEIKRLRDIEAVARRIYYAAYWTPDRDCNADKLWMELRNIAKFPIGCAPKSLL